MPRLHLKRTPAEEEERARRKSRKDSKRRKEKRRSTHSDNDDSERKHRRHHRSRSRSPRRTSARRSRKYYNQDASSGDPGPSSYSNHVNHDDEASQSQMEDERFEEKLRDALEDDGLYDPTQRLDNVEARLNSYAHIPRRWRGTDEGFSAGLWMEDAREDIGLEPWQMNDDEYAEYMRAGMWRKKNQAEFEERLRKKEERKRREEREQRRREETKKLEREAEVEREKRSAARLRRRLEEARRSYEERWNTLLAPPTSGTCVEDRSPISFDDIPWPISTTKQKLTHEQFIEQLTKDAVSSFLLRSREEIHTADGSVPFAKDILRATMLRFHPDKFEVRILARVEERDRELVREAANAVVRVLNDLLKDLRD